MLLSNKSSIKSALKPKFTGSIWLCADFETLLIKDQHLCYLWAITYCSASGYVKTSFDTLPLVNLSTECELVSSFMRYLLSLQKSSFCDQLIVYFHNLSFDGIFILRNLKKSSYVSIVRDSSIYQINYKNIIIFRCSFNLFHDSLENVAKTTLLKSKLIEDIYNYSTMLDAVKFRSKLVNYCCVDTVLLKDCLLVLNRVLCALFGCYISFTIALTVSGLSYFLFRFKYLTAVIEELPTVNVKSTVRASYLGGCCEVYKPYGRNVYYYDVNSAYPSVMLRYNMPLNVIKPWYKLEVSDLKGFFGFLTVTLEVTYCNIPFIMLKNRNGVNVSPTGTFTLVVFSEELIYALSINKIKILSIHTAISFSSSNLFKSYVLSIYKLKKQFSQASEEVFYKLMLNTLYGRLAIKSLVTLTKKIKTKDLPHYFLIYKSSLTLLNEGPNYSLISIEEPKVSFNSYEIQNGEIRYYCDRLYASTTEELQQSKYLEAPHIAAAIAAYSRIDVDKLKRNCLKLGYNLNYSDTDSLVTNNSGLKSSYSLGGVKLDYVIKSSYFILPKVYCFVGINVKTKKFAVVKRWKGLPKQELLKLGLASYKSLLEEGLSAKSFEWLSLVKKNYAQLTYSVFPEFKVFLLKTNKRHKIFKDKRWVDTLPLEF